MADAGDAEELDDSAIAPRVQNAVDRLLPAVEATAAQFAAAPTHGRDAEQAARALVALTRTLRELNALLKQRRAATAAAVEAAEAPDLDEMRDALARRINALTERCSGDSGGEEAADDGPAAITPPAGP